MFQKIPIAWLQLKYQKGQTIAAILGIAFTAILLFMQIGFRSGFLASLVQLPSSYQSEVFLMSASTETILRPVTFSKRSLYQALEFIGLTLPSLLNHFAALLDKYSRAIQVA